MAPSERRALFLLLSVAIAGHVVRRIAARPGEAPGGIQVLATSAAPVGSPAAHRDSIARLARPLDPGERIDVDRASAQELARLPRVGLSLAKAIVANRDANGPFGGLTGLDRVSGIGPGLLKLLEPHVSFSGTPAHAPAQASRGPADSRTLIEVVNATSSMSHGASPAGVGTPIDLNTASVSELDALPSVGKTRAQAIVRYRESHGPFLSVEALARVPGIGPSALARLRPLVTVH